MDLQRVLLMDTCGAESSVALANGDAIVGVRAIAERAASAQLLATVDEVLREAGWAWSDVQAVGVVNGPGSFTGVRVGLAAAKGFCEVLGVPMAAVSRLEVLREVAGMHSEGLAVLDAGRGEVFVRGADDREQLMTFGELAERSQSAAVAICEPALQAKLGSLPARLIAMTAADACSAVRRCLSAGGSDVALTDANYVRGEADIYAKKKSEAVR